MRSRGQRGVAALVAALGVLLARSTFAQCAMCGTALSSPDDPLARGLFWSVVFLISLPYAIVGAFIAAIAWAHHRAKLRRERSPLRAIGGGWSPVAGGKEISQ
jgi:hypothetical protein